MNCDELRGKTTPKDDFDISTMSQKNDHSAWPRAENKLKGHRRGEKIPAILPRMRELGLLAFSRQFNYGKWRVGIRTRSIRY